MLRREAPLPRLILVCVLLALVTPDARGQVTIDATDQPLTTLVDALAGAAGRTIVAQAVVLDDPPIAIVSGRAYEPGETIVDPATGEEVEGLYLDVDEVGPRHAVVVVESTGERVRLLLD